MTAKSLLRRLDRIIGELEQMIRDAEHWNGLPHNRKHTPLDVEWERCRLAEPRKSRPSFVAAAEHEERGGAS